jgi:hypothetical protein
VPHSAALLISDCRQQWETHMAITKTKHSRKGGNFMKPVVLSSIDFYPVIEPILEILDAILWPTIAVVVAVGTIYCIFLGVKISKADEQNSREKAKKDLLGAIVGFVIIFVLILALKIAVPILENWVQSQM